MALPLTIEEVIQQLEQIIKDCESRNRREGYFAALYLRVTKEVSHKINEKYFDNNERMEQFDVAFANRYLLAYDQYKKNQPCTASWRIAFEACSKWHPVVMQHLFAGMNAHISLDLGIAAATICPGRSIQSLYNDFNKINTILAELVNTVENQVSEIWPILKPINWIAGKLDEKVAVFSMDIARDAAWNVALQYAPLHEKSQQQNDFITTRDRQVASFGGNIVQPGMLFNTLITVLRVFERGTVKNKIEILNEKKSDNPGKMN